MDRACRAAHWSQQNDSTPEYLLHYIISVDKANSPDSAEAVS
jgi:hypothetical protein